MPDREALTRGSTSGVVLFDHISGSAKTYATIEDVLQAFSAERMRLRAALEAASTALSDARNGLDLGLGCARDLENDNGPRATKSRAVMQEAHLERARAAHRAVKAELAEGMADG